MYKIELTVIAFEDWRGDALIPRLPAGVDDQVVSHFRSSAKAVILENRHKLLAFGRGSCLGCTYEIHPSPGTRKARLDGGSWRAEASP